MTGKFYDHVHQNDGQQEGLEQHTLSERRVWPRPAQTDNHSHLDRNYWFSRKTRKTQEEHANGAFRSQW